MHDLAAELPAPRDDEPANLRRDIVDELADHLHCAVDRERQRAALEGDQAAAQNQDQLWPRVVARFGHPARIARQLWWDAMKEKIMSQRTQTATLIIMSLFCVAMMIVTLMALADSRQLAENNRELNKQLLAQLEEFANRPAPEPVVATPATDDPAEWNQLTVRCRWGSEDGPPAEGVQVLIQGQSENTAGIPSGAEVSDAEGIVDFGQVLYGTYRIDVTTPNHFQWEQEVAVRPGQDKTITLICPEGAGLGTVSLTPRFDWSSVPESLRGRVWVHCAIQQSFGPDSEWNADPRNYEWPPHLQTYGEKVASESGFDPTIASFLFNEAGQMIPAEGLAVDPPSTVSSEDSQLLRVTWNWYQLPENPEPVESIELPTGRYHIDSSVVIADPADESGRRLLAIGLFSGDWQWGPVAPEQSRDNTGGQDETSWLRMQLGQLPLSYLAPALPPTLARHFGMSPMGGREGPMGGSTNPEPPRLVHWDTPAAWEFQVEFDESFIAELALRVPLGMEIAPVSARIMPADAPAVTEGGVVDLVWKGLMVQADGTAVAEEHVLLRGVDLITTGDESVEDASESMFRELYVPLTPEELAILNDDAIVRGLWFRPSTDPRRASADPLIDGALIEHLRADSVPYPDYYPIDLPETMHLITLKTRRNDPRSDRSDVVLQRGSTCAVLGPPVPIDDGGFGTRYLPIIANRLVVYPEDDPEDAEEYDVQILVTLEEAELIELASTRGEVITVFTIGPHDHDPLEQTPGLEQVRQKLEAFPATDSEPAAESTENGEFNAESVEDPR